MQILHISDTHFDCNNYIEKPDKIEKALIQLIKGKVSNFNNFYILVTGDISYAGNYKGFTEAKSFFDDVISSTGCIAKNFLICPGNHDISDSSFECFDSFSYGIRKDYELVFNNESNKIIFDSNNCFLSINTSYHLNHTFGKIDIDHLSNLLDDKKQEITQSNTKIIFFHHNILNMFDKDNSAIKNSYNFFSMIKQYNFNFIFHGHQHTRQLFDINGIKINSTSSLLEKRTSSNVVSFYNIDHDDIVNKEEYDYYKDSINEDGSFGKYNKIEGSI